MKPSYFFPPVLSLVIAGGWIGSQRVSIGKLEEETVVLRERIELVRNGSMDGGVPTLATRMKGGGEGGEGGIDWKDLGDKLARADHGEMPDMRAMMELQTTLMGLSGEELLAELDRIDGMDLSKDVRKALDGMLIGLLAQKEPKAVLDRFLDRMNDRQSGMAWQLSNAFRQWQTQ